MPAKDIHVQKANANEAFAMSLPLDSQVRVDWTLIALFYSAMHYVEAYLAISNTHLRSHTTRDQYVGRDANLKKIWSQYQDLKFFGYNARYEAPQFTARDVTTNALPQLAMVKAAISRFL
ncbi:MAG: hypothetical protein ABI823_14955 [Bryobacteraceae bacterium]